MTIHRGKRRASGFTMIELLVGMVVGLIATVVMFQVFAVSEGQKRTTTGAGDAQQNGVGSVFLIERDARMAGYGMSYLPLLGCWVNGFYEPSNTPFTFRMAPFEIKNGAGGTPDTLTIAYGDSRNFTAPEKLNQDMPSAAAPFRVYNRYGFALGDLVLLVGEPDEPCTLYQVQSLPGLPSIDNIGHDPGPFVDAKGLARTTQFNRAGGVPVTLPVGGPAFVYKQWNISSRRGGRLMNLGQNPTVITYALQGSQLVAINTMLPGGAPNIISDGIVQFQVQYAYDQNGDGSVASTAPTTATLNPAAGDQWTDALPVNPTNAMWQGIVAVRFAIVSRSITPEKPDPATNICNATTANPQWLAAGVALDVASADPLNWRCYRYRVFEVTVPARNLIWLPDENA